MANLHRRLRRIERELPSPAEVEQEDLAERARIERENGLWLTLFSTMAPEHVEHVTGQLLTLWTGERGFPSELTRQANALVSRRLQQEAFFPHPPLALPAAIAQVYLDDPEVLPLHDCESCGQELPVRPGQRQPFRLAYRYFEACPVCGGHTGYAAHYCSMHGAIQRCQDCDGMQPSTPEQERFLARHHRARCSCRYGHPSGSPLERSCSS